MSTKLARRWTCVLAFGSTALFAQTAIPTVVRTTGMVGLAEGQTARLNLLNPGVLPAAVGMVCTAGVAFVDGAGNTVKSVTVTVAPGTSGGVNLDSLADLNLPIDGRRQIRAVITLPSATPTPVATSASTGTPTSTTPIAACKLIPTLEIFDTLTGRTLVSLGGIHNVPIAVVPATN